MAGQEKAIAAVVLAGGKGTRFQSVLDGQQKVLYKLGGKPLLQYSIDLLDHRLVYRLVFNLWHQMEEVKAWVLSAGLPHRVDFSLQTEPTVFNAITTALKQTHEPTVIICHGDEVRLGLDLGEVIAFHRQHGRMMTLVANRSAKLRGNRVYHVREDDHALLSHERISVDYRETPGETMLINVGFAILEQDAIPYFLDSNGEDWGKMIDPLCRMGEVSVYTKESLSCWNIGTAHELADFMHYLDSRSDL